MRGSVKRMERHCSREFFKVMFHWLRLHLTKMKHNGPINVALLSKKKKKSY